MLHISKPLFVILTSLCHRPQVMGDMENQRHQLLSAHEKVLETRGFISDARQTLSTMGWRELQHKAMLVAIIILLFASICLVLWFRFINKPKKR